MRTKPSGLTLSHAVLAFLVFLPALSNAQERVDVYYRPERTPQGDRVTVHWTTTFPSASGQTTFRYKYSTVEGATQQTAQPTHVFHKEPKDETSPVTGVAFQAAFELTPAQLATLERLEILSDALSIATQQTIAGDRVTVDADGIRTYFNSLETLRQLTDKARGLEGQVVKQAATIDTLRSSEAKLPRLDIDVKHIGLWKYAALVELTTSFPATVELQAVESDGNTRRGAPVIRYVSRGSAERFLIQPLTPDTPFYLMVSATDPITNKPFPLSRTTINDDHGLPLRTVRADVSEPQVQFVQGAATYNPDLGQVNFSIKAENVKQVLAAIFTSKGTPTKKAFPPISVSEADWYGKKDVVLQAELPAGQYDVRLWALNQADDPSTVPERQANDGLALTVSTDPVTKSVAISFGRSGITFKAATDTDAIMTVAVGDLEKKSSKEPSKNPEVTIRIENNAQSSKSLQFNIEVNAADGSRRSLHELVTLGVNDLASTKDNQRDLINASNAVNTGKAPNGAFWKSGLGTVVRLIAQALIYIPK